MTSFLKRDFLKLSLALTLFSNDLKAMDIIETPNEFLVESTIKYPKKIFDAEEFVNALDDKVRNKTAVELDLSNDASLNYMDVRKILSYLNKRDIKVNFLNLSNTNMDENVFSIYKALIDNPKFKYLDISNTPAVETEEDFSKNEKIIFIEKNMLKNSRNKLEKAFGQDVINRHVTYYEKTQSFLERKKNLNN